MSKQTPVAGGGARVIEKNYEPRKGCIYKM